MTKKFDDRCKAIARNLRKARKEKGWTQEELAERADAHVSYIGQIERGLRYPSLKVLFKIADALHVVKEYRREDTNYEENYKKKSNRSTDRR